MCEVMEGQYDRENKFHINAIVLRSHNAINPTVLQNS